MTYKQNNLERIPSLPPTIPTLPENVKRPLWSVMIPTYNCSEYVEVALLSVLRQDPGPDIMQIEVVDDFSSDADVEKIVKKIGKGRVGFFRQPANVGSLRNFETCINRAQGRIVHLLHGDDAVRGGFYKTMTDLFTRFPEAGAAFCAYNMIREDGSLIGPSQKESDEPGILENWLYKVGVESRLQYACMTVKREVYESIGSFYLANYGEDWEMWTRIAKHYPVAYSPEILAEYRVHGNSITGSSFLTGANVRDISKVIDKISSHFPPEERETINKKARRYYANDFVRKLYSLWFKTASSKVINIQIKELLKLYGGLDVRFKIAVVKLVTLFPHQWLVNIRTRFKSNEFIPQNRAILSDTQVHVALAFDESYFTPFYVLLTSIFLNNRCRFVFHVIATGLTEVQKKEIVKFVHLNNSEILFFDIEKNAIKDLIIPEETHFSSATYYRLYFPELLPGEIEKLIYLDVDIVVVGDLLELYNTDVTFPTAAVLDINEGTRPELGIYEQHKYFNSGVLLINLDKWKREEVSQKTIKFLIDFPERIKWVDQDALNAVLVDNWQPLDRKFNVTFYDVPRYLPKRKFKDFVNAKTIVHYTTHNKPWIANCTNRLRYLYFYYLDKSPHSSKPTYWSTLSLKLWGRRLKRGVKEFLVDHTNFFAGKV